MIEVFDFEQGSPEWVAIRLGIPTASEFKAVLAKGEGRTRRTYMMKLLGERLTGEPADNYINDHMDRGKVMEAEARETYALIRDLEPVRVGFIRNGVAGCSPDSLIGDDGLLEIKTKLAHLQLDALEADRLPPEHIPQVQGQLWVAERKWLDFVSYWPRLPLFVKRIYRDEAYIEKLRGEVSVFNAELDSLTAKMIARGATLARKADVSATA
jgi:hypothetical protein